jgi:hypothetical protein
MALTLTMDLKHCAMSIAIYFDELLTPRDIAAESRLKPDLRSDKKAVAAAIADPLKATLRKPLPVFIEWCASFQRWNLTRARCDDVEPT